MAAKTPNSGTTNPAVRELEPRALWNHFADLNAVPRPSKQEQLAIDFVRRFGEQLGLPTSVDQTGNVVIRKPASSDRTDRVPVVLQSHLDMVCQKNADTDFDFETQGIEMQVDGDWVSARGTTLGADNGIGVASILTVLASRDIAHPPLEALFTVDEETGMTGAKGLRAGRLAGKILLNLDSEEDNELTIGCAGGVDVTATLTYRPARLPAPNGAVGVRLIVRGLEGGHSGIDIHKGYANANKIMNRLLWRVARELGGRVAAIDGGGLRNAIPRESLADVVIDGARLEALEHAVRDEGGRIRAEYRTTDPGAEVTCKRLEQVPSAVLPDDLQGKLLGAIDGVHSGIHRMSPEIASLVQTSNNLARVCVKDGEGTIACLTRSSVDSERDELARAIVSVLELTGATVEASGDYPGWKPDPEATIVGLMSALYEELHGEPAHVAACHAGLECGIIGTNYPKMQMISFGPNIRRAHSPDECVQISSVQKYWRFLLETLARIPAA